MLIGRLDSLGTHCLAVGAGVFLLTILHTGRIGYLSLTEGVLLLVDPELRELEAIVVQSSGNELEVLILLCAIDGEYDLTAALERHGVIVDMLVDERPVLVVHRAVDLPAARVASIVVGIGTGNERVLLHSHGLAGHNGSPSISLVAAAQLRGGIAIDDVLGKTVTPGVGTTVDEHVANAIGIVAGSVHLENGNLEAGGPTIGSRGGAGDGSGTGLQTSDLTIGINSSHRGIRRCPGEGSIVEVLLQSGLELSAFANEDHAGSIVVAQISLLGEGLEAIAVVAIGTNLCGQHEVVVLLVIEAISTIVTHHRLEIVDLFLVLEELHVIDTTDEAVIPLGVSEEGDATGRSSIARVVGLSRIVGVVEGQTIEASLYGDVNIVARIVSVVVAGAGKGTNEVAELLTIAIQVERDTSAGVNVTTGEDSAPVTSAVAHELGLNERVSLELIRSGVGILLLSVDGALNVLQRSVLSHILGQSGILVGEDILGNLQLVETEPEALLTIIDNTELDAETHSGLLGSEVEAYGETVLGCVGQSVHTKDTLIAGSRNRSARITGLVPNVEIQSLVAAPRVPCRTTIGERHVIALTLLKGDSSRQRLPAAGTGIGVDLVLTRRLIIGHAGEDSGVSIVGGPGAQILVGAVDSLGTESAAVNPLAILIFVLVVVGGQTDTLALVGGDTSLVGNLLTVVAQSELTVVGRAIELVGQLVEQATITLAVDSRNELHHQRLALVDIQAIEGQISVVAVGLLVATGNVLVLSKDIERSSTVLSLGLVNDGVDGGAILGVDDEGAQSAVLNGLDLSAVGELGLVATGLTITVDGVVGSEVAETLLPATSIVTTAIDSLPVRTFGSYESSLDAGVLLRDVVEVDVRRALNAIRLDILNLSGCTATHGLQGLHGCVKAILLVLTQVVQGVVLVVGIVVDVGILAGVGGDIINHRSLLGKRYCCHQQTE